MTQDYGVAAMILGKGGYGIHQSGKWYTNENIDQMLMERHLAKKARNTKKRQHLKGPAKRTELDNKRFEEAFGQVDMYNNWAGKKKSIRGRIRWKQFYKI
mgnify:CR=1 FL=1